MKEASVVIKLSKESEVSRDHVTPVEAMLLCAEHHKNVGDCPVRVVEGTIKDVLVETGEKDAKTGKPITRPRTIDEELDRLKERYAINKVKALISEVKDIPTDDFAKALDRGMKIALPSNKMTEMKVV
jgi:hypothetical protein